MSSIGAYATSRRGAVSMAEIEAVRSKLGSRATVAQIAKMIGRCEADVRAVLQPPKDESRPAPEAASHSANWSDEDVAMLRGKYVHAGSTARAISVALGRTHNAVVAKISQLKLQRTRRAA